MKQIILSTHIPKTGGTTFKEILKMVYGDKCIWALQSHSAINAYEQIKHLDFSNIDIIHGHFSYGLHELLPKGFEYKYITFLRNPIERLLSYHNFILRPETYDIYKWDIAYKWSTDVSFMEWIQDTQIASQDNGMTRFFSGNNCINTHPINEKVTMNDLTLAMKNLNTYYFIGQTENFSNDLKKLSSVLCWDSIPEYKIHYHYPTRMYLSDLNKDDIQLIKNSQKFDFMLWEYSNSFKSA